MANEKKLLHGEPIHADSRSKEPWITGDITADVGLTFRLNLEKFGMGVVEDWIPPTRFVARVRDVLTGGPDALKQIPSDPQPNTLWGRLLPPPKKPPKK